MSQTGVQEKDFCRCWYGMQDGSRGQVPEGMLSGRRDRLGILANQ